MKTIFGYFLIIFSFSLIIMIGFPQLYSTKSPGRVDKKMQLDFDFLKGEKSPTVLLFFGYVNCGDICPPAMIELGKIYEKLNKNRTKVYFVNVLDTTNKELPQSYAKGYHKDFKGIYLDIPAIKKITKKLDLALIKISDQVISHSGYLYVLQKDLVSKKYILKYIYTTRPFDEKSIITDVNLLTQTKRKI